MKKLFTIIYAIIKAVGFVVFVVISIIATVVASLIEVWTRLIKMIFKNDSVRI